jgi:hypothetical protein
LPFAPTVSPAGPCVPILWKDQQEVGKWIRS